MEEEIIKVCTGCGHRSNEPLGFNLLGEPFLGCCPDSNYVVLYVSSIDDKKYQ